VGGGRQLERERASERARETDRQDSERARERERERERESERAREQEIARDRERGPRKAHAECRERCLACHSLLLHSERHKPRASFRSFRFFELPA
jgi:hypothetical protein